jgi:hypothetical protein
VLNQLAHHFFAFGMAQVIDTQIDNVPLVNAFAFVRMFVRK